MVKSAAEAAAKYRFGVETFGFDNYKRCGDMKNRGFLAVAQCLQDAKRVSLTLDNMVRKYQAAAER